MKNLTLNGENLSFFKLVKLIVKEFKKLEKGVEPNLLIFSIYGWNQYSYVIL